jgi:chemotaxis signal transduction protein
MTNHRAAKKDQTKLLQFVSFQTSNEEFCIDIQSVQVINRISHITKVPNTTDAIEYVTNLSRRIISFINLCVNLIVKKKQ